jgi:hypothetical protein
LCKRSGRCTLRNSHRACIAATEMNDECHPSEACPLQGQCTVQNMSCVATQQSDCENSVGCKEEGLCALNGTNCQNLQSEAQKQPSR